MRGGLRFLGLFLTAAILLVALATATSPEPWRFGIGFYPLRGNHEAKWDGPAGSGPEFGLGVCGIDPTTHTAWAAVILCAV
jgi:hypothetical protein